MPHGGATEHENYSPPLEGCRGGLFRTGLPTPKATPSAPPQRGFSEKLPMPPRAAPQSMKIIPLHGRGAGVGCPEPDCPPRRLRLLPLPRGDFQERK
jgi:hypothetical protein